ncbi:MAG: cyclomaltodextrinase C-terminal domain-containing protein, partial [Bacteroidota bacterium]
IWWVEYLGLSGIRMDTYPYPDMDYMAEWTRALMKEYPNLNIVGEEWFEWPSIVSYWQKGKTNSNGYQSDLKSVMDFPVQAAMGKALTQKETWGTGWIELYEMLAQDFLYPDPTNLVIFPDNHDMSRIFTQVNEDLALFKQALVFVLTTRGIPQIYYGTEVLMKNPGTEDHGIIRSDFPGGWAGDKVNAMTGEGLTELQKNTQSWLKKLLQWRKTANVIHSGKLKHFIPKDGIYLYARYDEQQKVVVILNKNEKETTIELSPYAELFDGESKGTDVLSNKVYPLKEQIRVPAQSATILELSK